MFCYNAMQTADKECLPDQTGVLETLKLVVLTEERMSGEHKSDIEY